jgi:predicted Zn-dependent peptidase
MPRALALMLVLGTAVVAAQTTPDRMKTPQPGPAPSLTLPPVQAAQLSNGLRVRLVEMHEVPIVKVALVVAAGASEDPAGKFGVAALTAAMLDEGAGSRSALEIADEVAYLGATLGTSSSYDASTISAGVPVARLEPTLALMADVARRPTFPAAELERLRTELLTGMLQAKDNPAAVASLAFPRLLFGTTHRYGTAENGTPETVKAMTVDDLRAFYQARYRPDTSHLLVVGDVTQASVLPLLERAFGTWSASGPTPARAAVPASPQPASRRIVLVDKPGAAQSQIRIGWVGVPRATPDYFPLTVANTLFGGSFTSRLNTNLRETHGYAYGASSQFVMRRHAGPFVAAAGVQTDKTGESVREFFNEFDAIRKPIPDDEFVKAQGNVALGFPGEFETTGDLISRLQAQVVLGLPDDVYSTYVQHVMAVTTAQAGKAMVEHVQPAKFLVVVVGDREKVEAPLKALKLGAVTVLSVDDALK